MTLWRTTFTCISDGTGRSCIDPAPSTITTSSSTTSTSSSPSYPVTTAIIPTSSQPTSSDESSISYTQRPMSSPQAPTLSTQGSMPSTQGSTASTVMWTAEDKETTPSDGATESTPEVIHNFTKHITTPVGPNDVSGMYPFKSQRQLFFSTEKSLYFCVSFLHEVLAFMIYQEAYLNKWWYHLLLKHRYICHV